jgi:hypothetical protein
MEPSLAVRPASAADTVTPPHAETNSTMYVFGGTDGTTQSNQLLRYTAVNL